MSHSIPTPDFMTTLDPTRDYKINVRSNNPNQPGQKEPSFISVAHSGLLSNNPNVLSTFTNESSEHCTLNFINEQGETVVSRGEPLDEAELGAFLEFDEVTQEFYLTLLDAQYVFRDPQDQENVQDNLLSEIEAAFEDVPQPDTEPDPLPPKVTRPIDPPSKPTTSSRSQLKVTSPTRKRRSPASRPTSNYNSIPTHTNQSSSEITNLSDKLNSAHLNKSTRSPVKKPIPTTKPKPKSKPTKPEKVPSPEAASPPADDDSFGCFDLIGIDAKSEPEVEPDTMEEVEFSDFGDEIFEDVDDSLMEEPVKVPSPEPVVKPAPKATVKPPAKPASKPVHKRTGADKKETTQKKKYRSSSSESSSSSSGSSSSGSGSSSSGSSSSSSGSSSDSDSDSNSDSEEDKKPPVKAKSKSKPKPKPKSKPKSPPVSQPAQPVVETTKGFSDNDFADIGAEAASGLSDQFDEVDFGFDQPSEPLPAIDLFQAKSSSEDEAPAPVLPPSSTTAPPQLNSSDFSSDNDQRYEKVTLNFSDDDDNSFDLV